MASVTGLDAVKLIPMIVQAANRACMHEENCRQLAEHLEAIGELLKVITISKIKRYPAARKVLERLEKDLRKSRRLVKRCQNRNCFYVLLMGWNIENQFKELEKKIDRSLIIIPIINLRDDPRVKELQDKVLRYKEKAERAAAKEKAAAKERARAERAAAEEKARAERAERAAAEERRRAQRAAAERVKRAERAAAEERERARAERAAAEKRARAERAAAEERERERERERAAKGRPEKTTAKKRTDAAEGKARPEKAAKGRPEKTTAKKGTDAKKK